MKLKRTIHLDLIIIVSISLLGCPIDGRENIGRDTCTQGDNMTNLRMGAPFDAQVAVPGLLIVWDIGTERGAELPASYFAAVTVAYETDDAIKLLIDGVAYTNQREITVMFADLATYLASNTILGFTLAFPDRNAFIDCTHPGSADRYLLDVSLVFDASANLVSSTFTERKELGPI